MKRYVPLLLAFATGFAVCWVVRDSSNSANPADVTQAKTAFIVESPDATGHRKCHAFRIVRARDVQSPQPGEGDFIRAHNGWHLSFGDGRYFIYLVETPDPLADQGGTQAFE